MFLEFISSSQKIKLNHHFFSWDIADWRIPQFHWLRVFCFITQKPTFSQIWYLCMQKTNDMTLFSTRYRESNVEIFRKTYKTLLIKLIKPIFGQKMDFCQNIGLCQLLWSAIRKENQEQLLSDYWAKVFIERQTGRQTGKRADSSIFIRPSVYGVQIIEGKKDY